MQMTLDGAKISEDDVRKIHAEYTCRRDPIAFGRYCEAKVIQNRTRKPERFNIIADMIEYFGFFTENMVHAMEVYYEAKKRGMV